ncbi:MAG: hypothetical protein NVS9B1_08740 [Candidatus Dormibacteraceae bacterium]
MRVNEGRARLETSKARIAKLDAEQAVNEAQAEKGTLIPAPIA